MPDELPLDADRVVFTYVSPGGWATRRLSEVRPEPPAPNFLVAWHAGEPKTSAYVAADIVDSRRLPADVVDAAQLAGMRAACLRLDRICREQGFEYHFQARAFLREQSAAADAAREWPVVDTQDWTVHSDQTLTGEAVAEALGLDEEWRTVLDVPPNTGLSWDQIKRLSNLALTRSYLENVDRGMADLFGEEPLPRTTLAEAARVFDAASAEQQGGADGQ